LKIIFEVKKMAKKEDNAKAVEELVILKPCRVRPDGEREAKLFNKGERVKVAGNDKLFLLSSGKAEVAGKQGK
jgi:ribosomal protein L23